MTTDSRKLCAVCAWRGTCQLKYSMPDGLALHCPHFTRDITIKEPDERIKRNILIVGPPLSGKTRLVNTVLSRTNLVADGYYTRKVTRGLFRTQLEWVRVLDGAVVWTDLEPETQWRKLWTTLGIFGVDIDAIEGFIVRTLGDAVGSRSIELIVLDEVGWPAARSELFRQKVVDCLTSDKSVLATMKEVTERDSWLAALQKRVDVTLLRIGKDDYERMVEQVLTLLEGRPAKAGVIP